MFRSVFLLILLGIGVYFWCSPLFSYLDLVNPLQERLPRYVMEFSLALSFSFLWGVVAIFCWLLRFLDQETYPIAYPSLLLFSGMAWHLAMRDLPFESFYKGEPGVYALTILYFHFAFTIGFALFCLLSSEEKRFTIETKIAVILMALGSILLVFFGISEILIFLLYAMMALGSFWLGIQALSSCKPWSRFANHIGWILALPGVFFLTYLLAAPHLSDWLGAKLLAYRSPKFQTKLTILGEAKSVEKKRDEALKTSYRERLQADKERYRSFPVFTFLFLFLAILFKTSWKRQKEFDLLNLSLPAPSS